MSNYGKGTSLSKALIYIFFISLCGLLLFNYFKGTNWGKGRDYTSKPTAVDVKYVPAEYNFDVDDDNLLHIITNPDRYTREFNDLVYDFNMSMLNHVADRMDLVDSIRFLIEPEYQEHHAYIRDMYYKDFTAIRDTSANLHESWYSNNFTSATEAFHEVSSNYSCYLINQVIMNTLLVKGESIVAIGNSVESPCMIALKEAVRPFVKRLNQRAGIMDFSRSKGMMEERVEKAIAELATMEIRDRKGLSKEMQTRVWGYSVSTTEMQISAISILKVGFKLDKFFEINLDGGRNQVVVTLPDPQVLSHEVYPRIDKLDVGWLRELDQDDFNKNFNVLRREFRKDAVENNVMDKAKVQADELMHLMLEPIVKQLGGRFKLLVRFKRMGKTFEEEMESLEASNLNG